jgi:hypothetical protein
VRRFFVALSSVLLLALMIVGPAGASTSSPDNGLDDDNTQLGGQDPSAALDALDAVTTVVSEGPFASVIKNLAVAGRGERLLPNGTTDVWAHRGTAYVGTFNVPCGTGEGFRSDTGPVSLIQDRTAPGVVVFDVRNVNRPTYLGNLPSVEGSRVNDIKVARQSGRDILVHSNEACAGGDGGFEVYDMTKPRQPVHLASVRVDDANQVLRDTFGVVNVGVHNLFLFSQGSRHYVGMQTHAEFGGFQIWELTDPTDPQFVSAWGAEYLCEGTFCSDDPHAETDSNVILDVIFGWMRVGFGSSANKYLHDVTVTDDGTLAYLSHWDAGLILLDISDPANPVFVSQALDPTAGDGEVNSHAAWPTADGRVVVETEEDFDALPERDPLSNWTVGDLPTNTIPALGVSTSAGDDFEANQTGNVVRLSLELAHHMVTPHVTVLSGPLAPNVYAATEAAGNQPTLADTGPIEAEAVWVGRACDTDRFNFGDVPGIVDPLLNDPAGKIAVVRRGACTFASKLAHVADAGAIGIVVANNQRGESQWGNVRIWDYSDPTSPVLASEFDTVCSKTPRADICDPRGTYSVHNVVVEGNKAYFSWYSDGVLILDISDPYNPVEIARFSGRGEEFEMQNGGIQDVWGIWKEPGKPWLYASDRNGGLYILKEYGAGSAKKGKP